MVRLLSVLRNNLSLFIGGILPLGRQIRMMNLGSAKFQFSHVCAYRIMLVSLVIFIFNP